MTELEHLQLQAMRGRISRREFLGRAAAAGATAAILATMTGVIDAHAAETPVSGGTLKLGVGGGSTTDSLDPSTWTDTVMVDAGCGYYNALVETGPDNKPIPELAESWEAKPGATEWVFNLRKGVTFHNGKTFDADDAIFSINLHRGQTKSGAAGSYKVISDVKKLTDNQILVTLSSGDADFPMIFSDYHGKMVPNGTTEFKGIGTGGYTVERFDPGVRASGKKFANYWKANRGHLAEFDITVINDTSARLNALVSGQVDVVNRVDPKQAGLVKKKPGLELVVAPGGWHTVVSMMQDKSPFDNLDVRMAFKYGIDRAQIVKTLFSGYGSLGNDHPIPKGDPYYNKELEQTAFDPDKAKFHLKKSGYSGAILLQASDAAFNGAVDMATLMQASCAKGGVKVDVKKEPADGFWDNVWLKGSCVTSYWAGRSTATQMLAVAYSADAPWNESHYKSPEFTKALKDAQAELDEGKRKALLWECQKLLHDDGATVVPAFRDWIDAHNSKVGGHTPHTLFDMDNGYIVDKAWIKA